MDWSHLAAIGLPFIADGASAAAAARPKAARKLGDRSSQAAQPSSCSGAGLRRQPASEFRAWLSGLLSAGAVGERYPELSDRVAAVATSWRERFPGRLWARLSRDNCATLVKEAREAVPVISFVLARLSELPAETGPITVLDLCSGLGFLGMLLAELLPPERVEAIVLMDQAWPLKGAKSAPDALAPAAAVSEAPDAAGESGDEADAAPAKASGGSRRNRTRLNWDHIYGLPWPVTLTTRRCDLKVPSTHAQILDRILEPAPGPVFVLGVHLCGTLSVRAVETFNRGPKCVGMVLKPCCLPSMEYVKNKTRWTLGAHSFAAEEVCMWGRYRKNQWQGPVKATLASRFSTWSHHLYRGIYADEKRYEKVPLVEGHYQDAYLLASRGFSSVPPPPSLSGGASAAADPERLIAEVLAASTPREVLGVPETSDLSMRALHRRWAALNKDLGALVESNAPNAAVAFKKVKEAFDAVRAERAGPEKASADGAQAGGQESSPAPS